jgi:hypothetical protein
VLDPKNLPLVDNSSVPSGKVTNTYWQEVFTNIPEGKSLVVTENDVSLAAIRSALYEFQHKGLFKDYKIRKIKDGNIYKIFVMHVNKKDAFGGYFK